MDMYVKSQVDRVISSYLGKCLMILVPSQSLQEGGDAAVKGVFYELGTDMGDMF